MLKEFREFAVKGNLLEIAMDPSPSRAGPSVCQMS